MFQTLLNSKKRKYWKKFPKKKSNKYQKAKLKKNILKFAKIHSKIFHEESLRIIKKNPIFSLSHQILQSSGKFYKMWNPLSA